MTNYFFFDKDQYYIFSKAKGFPKISGLGYSGFSIPDLQYLPGSQNFGDPRKYQRIVFLILSLKNPNPEIFGNPFGLTENVMLILINAYVGMDNMYILG